MAEKIAHPVEKGKRVTKLAFNHDQSLLEVGIAGESAPRSYAHVVSTVPFGCLRAIDTAGCSFPWALQTAIRTLHYDSSVKVGIQFSERWWEAEDKPRCLHKGGTSSTDRPSRTIVYPSYGIGKPESGATMIASYTWAQDAARIGSLIPKKASVSGEPKDTTLLDLVLGDLAAVHAMDVGELRKLVVNHKAFDWYADSNSSGTFSSFSIDVTGS
jgi:monoamine oxidase